MPSMLRLPSAMRWPWSTLAAAISAAEASWSSISRRRQVRNLFLDFREKAPLKASAQLFQNAEGQVVPGRSTGTYLGVGVPGTVMGLDEAPRQIRHDDSPSR